ncbi:MAG TPA: 4-hydroxy-tetrahydrodipicolinate reductase [Longimicrobiales bacterium]|nr:4-hydroxy-tetrahydrodipicolinate reductase [Longimicrobiales bacterium]
MTRVVIAGIRGRMGQTLVRLLEGGAASAHGLTLVGGIGRAITAGATATTGPAANDAAGAGGASVVPLATPQTAADMIAGADVVIDFTGAEGTRQLLEHCAGALRDRALVVGSTGLDDATNVLLDDLARHAAVLAAANFSIGVNLLAVLTERVAATLPAGRYDIEIVESHHRRKVDAPSGTALALGEAAARGRGVALQAVRRDGRSGMTGERGRDEIGFHAVRGGGVIGEHQVMFLGERERIELNHVALDRALFAEGALLAAGWLGGRPAGRYEMKDVLGIES